MLDRAGWLGRATGSRASPGLWPCPSERGGKSLFFQRQIAKRNWLSCVVCDHYSIYHSGHIVTLPCCRSAVHDRCNRLSIVQSSSSRCLLSLIAFSYSGRHLLKLWRFLPLLFRCSVPPSTRLLVCHLDSPVVFPTRSRAQAACCLIYSDEESVVNSSVFSATATVKPFPCFSLV